MKHKPSTVSSIEKESYFKFYKTLLHDERYKHLSFCALGAYCLLNDRLHLSIENKWIDDDGRTYIYYTIKNMADTLRLSERSTYRAFDELKNVGLIESIKQGISKPNKIYVNIFEAPDEKEATERGKNGTSYAINKAEILDDEITNLADGPAILAEGPAILADGDLPYWQSNKTNLNNTDSNKTYISHDKSCLDVCLFEDDVSVAKPKSKRNKSSSLTEKDLTEIITYLNNKTCSNFRFVPGNFKPIQARFKEGATMENFKAVIDCMTEDWGNSDLRKNLNPHTLFGDKFDKYLNQSQQPKTFKQQKPKSEIDKYEEL